VNGVRVPSRFTELLVFALAVLACYGLFAICFRVKMRPWRAALVGVLLIGVAVEVASTPFAVAGPAAPSSYSEVGAVHEPSTVLDLPLDWRIIKYHYYQTIPGKRPLAGHPVRSRDKYSSYADGLPLMPFLKDPKLLLERPLARPARRGTPSASPRSSTSATSSFIAPTWPRPSSRPWTGSWPNIFPTSTGGTRARWWCTR